MQGVIGAIVGVAFIAFLASVEIRPHQSIPSNQAHPTQTPSQRILASQPGPEAVHYKQEPPRQTEKKWYSVFLNHLPDWFVAAFTGLLAYVTWRLVKSTNKLWETAERDTRILQRAYVSVNPDGIETNTLKEFIGHVIFENAGNLPARDFSWRIKIHTHPGGDWVPGPLTAADLESSVVLPVGSKWKMGSGLLDPVPSQEADYVYVWGRVEYTDGFGKSRFTNFCHRYPWARRMAKMDDTTVLAISVSHARFHKHGNDAN